MKTGASASDFMLDSGGDPADAAQATTEIEMAPVEAAILERTYGELGAGTLPRCRVCLFPLYPELDPVDGIYCSNTCRRREEKL